MADDNGIPCNQSHAAYPASCPEIRDSFKRAIEITAEINLSEHIIINVSNDGRPISKESQEEIFIPFYTTKQEGTGIGLSLSRQIMRLHNGTLNLTRSDEKGTVFTMIFR